MFIYLCPNCYQVAYIVYENGTSANRISDIAPIWRSDDLIITAMTSLKYDIPQDREVWDAIESITLFHNGIGLSKMRALMMLENPKWAISEKVDSPSFSLNDKNNDGDL
jgi:hypothetical protein